MTKSGNELLKKPEEITNASNALQIIQKKLMTKT